MFFFCQYVCNIRWCVWTHQIIQHPHQRFKLQLPNFPLIQASHVHIARRGYVEDSRFVFLLVQHYQVVHATSTWDGIHLNPQSEDRGTCLWESTARHSEDRRHKGLFGHQQTSKRRYSSITKEYTAHGTPPTWLRDLFIKTKLGFAGWINVFFCSTREIQ